MHFLTIVAHAASISTSIYGGTSAASIVYERPAVLTPQLALKIMSNMNNTGNVIPGGSPFFYLEDPAKNLFTISSISMTPTPCQIGLPCAIEAKGTFLQDFKTVDLSFDIEARLKDGQEGKIIAFKDNLCNWATLDQVERTNCNPQNGAATISADMELPQGWVMEVNTPYYGDVCASPLLTIMRQGMYMIDLKLTSGDQMLTHVGARIVLTDPHNHINVPNTATS